MKKWLVRIFVSFVFIAMIGGAAAGWALRQTQQVPEFYTRATERLPPDLAAASQELEQDVEQLQDAASQLGSWSATFTEEQINAWLVQHLAQEFPKILPAGVEDPRIVIEDGRVLAAARYKNSRIDTVVSFELKVELTEHANVLAVRVEQLRAGSLPMPLHSFLRGISREAAKGDIAVVWDMDESGPVALVTVPSEHPKFVRTPIIIEALVLQSGHLSLAGHTGPQAWQTYRPRTPTYQLASARTGRKDQYQTSSQLPFNTERVR
ncbi:MAG: hypothetical protein ACO1RT_21130 [Planctomycetaceae bacterium]